MMTDVDQAAQAMRDEEMLAEIEDFIEGFNQPTYRGMRINGVRVATWSSRDAWSGNSRPDAGGSLSTSKNDRQQPDDDADQSGEAGQP
jgi:hypothetical protein